MEGAGGDEGCLEDFFEEEDEEEGTEEEDEEPLRLQKLAYFDLSLSIGRA